MSTRNRPYLEVTNQIDTKTFPVDDYWDPSVSKNTREINRPDDGIKTKIDPEDRSKVTGRYSDQPVTIFPLDDRSLTFRRPVRLLFYIRDRPIKTINPRRQPVPRSDP